MTETSGIKTEGVPKQRYDDGTLMTYMGPVPNDPDPGSEWHYGCDQRVYSFKEGQVCTCGESADWPE